MSKKNVNHSDLPTIRLDRWLWASRFFKTRALAKQAIEGGKVHLNGQRTKPSRAIKINETLNIRRGFELYTVVVMGLANKRGPAKVAVTLYTETDESLRLREKEAELRRIAQLAVTRPSAKPDKRQRRKIHQFKQAQD
ncbi:MAG: RNA-binding protein [Gammaproteobacteria bacterium]|nr:MAG: RNA-binding protein [Gammaproteobacteria bacterium]